VGVFPQFSSPTVFLFPFPAHKLFPTVVQDYCRWISQDSPAPRCWILDVAQMAFVDTNESEINRNQISQNKSCKSIGKCNSFVSWKQKCECPGQPRVPEGLKDELEARVNLWHPRCRRVFCVVRLHKIYFIYFLLFDVFVLAVLDFKIFISICLCFAWQYCQYHQRPFSTIFHYQTDVTYIHFDVSDLGFGWVSWIALAFACVSQVKLTLAYTSVRLHVCTSPRPYVSTSVRLHVCTCARL